MRNLLWLVNAFLAVLLLGLAMILFFARPSFVLRKKLTTSFAPSSTHAMPTVSIDIQRIYEKDPFGTVIEAHAPSSGEKVPVVEPVPIAPPLRTIPNTVPAAPIFLPPLSILLKGVIYSHHERDNRAIIADKKTRQEKLYKVGDAILDAEIIRIESNKVMFLRSNGQQETIFVSPLEAKADQLYQRAEGKYAVLVPIKKIDEKNFSVDPVLFVKSVANLAQFVDDLDITTVFEQGHSIGCRVGAVLQNSLGQLAGLQEGDIVISINDLPTATTPQRMAIYQQISHMGEGDVIRVDLLRGSERTPVKLSYTITSFNPSRPPAQPQNQPVINQRQPPEGPASVHNKSLHGRGNSENIVEKLHKQNKHAMLEHGGRSAAARPIKP